MFYSVICESNLLQHKHLGVYPINRIDRWGLSASDSVGIETPIWPTTSRRVTSRMDDDHFRGIDIGGTPAGTPEPIVASVGGDITYSGIPPYSASDSPYVILEGNDNRTHTFVHIDDITVETGDTVIQGEQLGTMSDQGSSGQIHLHYEVSVDGVRINPLDILPD